MPRDRIYSDGTYFGAKFGGGYDFCGKIKENSDGTAPLVMSDSWFYEQALVDNYSTCEQPVYKGRGRKPLAIQVVNPGYVESRNGKYRKSNARLMRKTLCHAKKVVFHQAQIDFLT